MEQFKTLEDLRISLAKLEEWFGRPIAQGEHPTLYWNETGTGNAVFGIRRVDYLFSADGEFIFPSRKHGLSFSSSWRHLRGVYNMISKVTGGKPVDVYWILQKADIPPGLEFVADSERRGHYLLCATQGMRVSELKAKLEWIADRMTVIRHAEVVL